MPLILVVLSESGFSDKVFTIRFVCVPQFICLVFLFTCSLVFLLAPEFETSKEMEVRPKLYKGLV